MKLSTQFKLFQLELATLVHMTAIIEHRLPISSISIHIPPFRLWNNNPVSGSLCKRSFCYGSLLYRISFIIHVHGGPLSLQRILLAQLLPGPVTCRPPQTAQGPIIQAVLSTLPTVRRWRLMTIGDPATPRTFLVSPKAQEQTAEAAITFIVDGSAFNVRLLECRY